MKTKPFILVFPIEVERDEVESMSGNVYTQKDLDGILSQFEIQYNLQEDILLFDLSDFEDAVNNQEMDILTESWIVHVNVIEEERP
jgi:hypothetical protein